MKRRGFLLGMIGAVTVGLPAWANYADDVVAQLTLQGYSNISLTRTWLGRVRILAYRDGGTREIVLNPRTGEILRDLWTATDGTTKTVSIVDDVKSSGSGKGSGSSGSDSGTDSGSGGGSDDGGSGGGSDGGSDGGSGGGSGDGGSDGGSGDGGSDGGSGGGSDDGGSTGGSTGGSGDGGSSDGSGDGGSGTGSSGGGTDDAGSDGTSLKDRFSGVLEDDRRSEDRRDEKTVRIRDR